MKFIGKLVHTTANIQYKRSFKKELSYLLQIETLNTLLKKARNTAFGKFYGFKKITELPGMVSAFQEKVPIVTYNQFYDQWLFQSLEGTKNVIWPGKIRFFALSSGTTGAPSKQIPISKQMLRSFQKTSIKQIATLCQLPLEDEFYQKQVLIIGGSTLLEDKDIYFQGDLSGILKKHTKKVASPFTRPGKKITDLKEWNKKLELIIKEAPKWDIGIIAGIPSWCVLLLEEIVKHHKLSSIHELWPNLKVYIHGGVFIEPYSRRLNQICEKPLYLFDTYLASEGYFGYQHYLNNKSMQLLLNNGIFFEFIPFNSTYFDEEGNIKDNHYALTLEEVQEGVNYAMIISTNAGLWRYLIGDTIQFTNVKQREIKITGRTKQYLSVTGEHLSLENMHEALRLTGEKLACSVEEFTVCSDKQTYQHQWYISIEKEIDNELFQITLDSNLSLLNDDYKSVRKYTLPIPNVSFVSSKLFYDFMEKSGKLGAQNKFPRVMNENQQLLWKAFLETQTTI
ncbi:MAG: GH3 auxin-responsive promoter family protein [Crocinitomicaceae bacterium]|jgi:hypothetical protein